MDVLCFTDFCIALHHCSNVRVRYGLTCMYSYVLFTTIIVSYSIIYYNYNNSYVMQIIHKNTCKSDNVELSHSNNDVVQCRSQ